MHRLTGMGWMVTVVVGMTIQSALVKWLGETLSSVQILWLRGAVASFSCYLYLPLDRYDFIPMVLSVIS